MSARYKMIVKRKNPTHNHLLVIRETIKVHFVFVQLIAKLFFCKNYCVAPNIYIYIYFVPENESLFVGLFHNNLWISNCVHYFYCR